jgi:hypothetical protein
VSLLAGTGWRKLRPLALIIVLIAAVPAILSLTPGADKRKRVYEVRSVHSVRTLDLKYERDYQYEATFEKCEIQSIGSLATALHVPATPDAVGRAYARRHEASIRETVYRGCRDAYLHRWQPPAQ